jgi:membrane-associated phospholipid phosphatase
VRIVTAAYFAYLAGMALRAPISAQRKGQVFVVSMTALLAIFIIGMPHIMPLAFLLIGYWVPALLVRDPDLRLEQRLLDFDRKLFGARGLEEFERRAPRVLIEYLELAYLLCYAAVPAGFACLLLAGHGADAIDRFWSMVLLASFICYGLLPWMATRAPRAIEPTRGATRSSVRRLNLAVLNRASVQWNTFPSGHTAASLATAFAVGIYMPVAGVVLAVIALSIAAGSVVGRYHYAADALAGAVAAIFAFVTVAVARGL